MVLSRKAAWYTASMIPRAVVFDLGNVFVHVDSGKGVAALTRRGVPREMFDGGGVVRSLLHAYERGEIDTQAFHEAVCGRLDTVPLARFCEIYCDIFTPVQAMIDVNDALRGSGLPTYVLSNTSVLHFEHLRARYEFMARFDRYFLSYEIGSVKPQPAIYEAVERGLALRGGEIAYIDDARENVEAALERGWAAIHHTEPARTVAALRELGLL